jgi:hypothetical protein
MARTTSDFDFHGAVEIWLMWWRGEKKHRIAAAFDTNVARVYDVCSYETLYPGSKDIALERWREMAAA